MEKKIIYRPDLADGVVEYCPLCGAPVAVEEEPVQETAQQPIHTPHTMEELEELCRSYDVPTDGEKFFLGKNEKQLTGYGLYVDEFGDYVFYRNHSDGGRAIRYKGRDESYAVGEMYRRMKAAHMFYRPEPKKEDGKQTQQQHRRHHHHRSSRHRRKQLRRLRRLAAVGVALLVCLAVAAAVRWYSLKPKEGYYHYQDRYYYLQQKRWYVYDPVMEKWDRTEIDSAVTSDYKTFYRSTYYWEGSPVSDFRDSGFYNEGLMATNFDVGNEPVEIN